MAKDINGCYCLLAIAVNKEQFDFIIRKAKETNGGNRSAYIKTLIQTEMLKEKK